jgi:hypothetical protein
MNQLEDRIFYFLLDMAFVSIKAASKASFAFAKYVAKRLFNFSKAGFNVYQKTTEISSEYQTKICSEKNKRN